MKEDIDDFDILETYRVYDPHKTEYERRNYRLECVDETFAYALQLAKNRIIPAFDVEKSYVIHCEDLLETKDGQESNYVQVRNDLEDYGFVTPVTFKIRDASKQIEGEKTFWEVFYQFEEAFVSSTKKVNSSPKKIVGCFRTKPILIKVETMKIYK